MFQTTMSEGLVLPNFEGIPTCGDVEPKWADVLKRGFLTPSQVVVDDMVLAELQFGNVFLGNTLLPLVRGVLVKNPYDEAPKKIYGVRNGIAKLENNLLVVVSEMTGVYNGWQIRRAVNLHNLNQPSDISLLSNSFANFLNISSRPIEI